MEYSQWDNLITKHGFKADLLISALQKTIRRADEETAARVAYEMITTSEELENMLWRRLSVITVEDIGFGNTEAPGYVHTLDAMRIGFAYGSGDRALFAIAAVRFLCRCDKERSNDHLKGIIAREFAAGKLPNIPDYAYDMHTKDGRAMGRGHLHFIEEASIVTPEHQLNRKYYDRLLELVKAESEE